MAEFGGGMPDTVAGARESRRGVLALVLSVASLLLVVLGLPLMESLVQWNSASTPHCRDNWTGLVVGSYLAMLVPPIAGEAFGAVGLSLAIVGNREVGGRKILVARGFSVVAMVLASAALMVVGLVGGYVALVMIAFADDFPC